jgi:protein-disulfide isomerase
MSGKKEVQRKKKEELQASGKRRERLTSLLWKGGAVLLGALALVVLMQGLFLAPPVAPPDQVTAADQVRGNPDAPVTLTVYADFQCPACLSETTLITRAWPQISDRTRLVFRHYPLDTHRHAFLAARYAEAAGRQDAFWQMHDILFANQALWSNVADAAPLFDGYAGNLGLDVAQLKSDVQLPELRDKILADQRSGTRAGVRATPTLFLNGRLLANNPRTSSELIELVNRAAQ